MKTLVTLIMFCVLWMNAIAQVPQKMSYQAVIRDAAGNLVTNKQVGMRITVLKGSLPGTAVYSETQTPVTNANGLVTIEIGGGSGFDAIDWGSGVYFIKTETDPLGGTNYTITVTNQLVSVPYALYSQHAADAATKAYVDALIGPLLKLGTILVDADGNYYPAIRIGSQIWMAENLKTTKYSDGTAIPLVTDALAWAFTITPGYCWYNNDKTTYGNIYGALYNWYAVNTGKLCPFGWHVPSDAEWTTLTTFLGGESAVGKMKEIGTSHWSSPNQGATNVSGFTALPGGYCYQGHFDCINGYTDFWSGTIANSPYAWRRGLTYGSTELYRDDDNKSYGFSVRCLKN